MFPVCNSWLVRCETKDKANLFLKAKLLDLFPAGAGAVNVSEKWQSPLRCTGKLRYSREVAQCKIEGNGSLPVPLELKRCSGKSMSRVLLHSTCS